MLVPCEDPEEFETFYSNPEIRSEFVDAENPAWNNFSTKEIVSHPMNIAFFVESGMEKVGFFCFEGLHNRIFQSHCGFLKKFRGGPALKSAKEMADLCFNQLGFKQIITEVRDSQKGLEWFVKRVGYRYIKSIDRSHVPEKIKIYLLGNYYGI